MKKTLIVAIFIAVTCKLSGFFLWDKKESCDSLSKDEMEMITTRSEVMKLMESSKSITLKEQQECFELCDRTSHNFMNMLYKQINDMICEKALFEGALKEVTTRKNYFLCTKEIILKLPFFTVWSEFPNTTNGTISENSTLNNVIDVKTQYLKNLDELIDIYSSWERRLNETINFLSDSISSLNKITLTFKNS